MSKNSISKLKWWALKNECPSEWNCIVFSCEQETIFALGPRSCTHDICAFCWRVPRPICSIKSGTFYANWWRRSSRSDLGSRAISHMPQHLVSFNSLYILIRQPYYCQDRMDFRSFMAKVLKWEMYQNDQNDLTSTVQCMTVASEGVARECNPCRIIFW